MGIRRSTRHLLAAVAAAALILSGSVVSTTAAQATAPPPSQVTRMAALGDSITLGVSSCSSWSGCAQNSWATGSSTTVGSHLLRLRAAGATDLVAFNDAVSGSRSAALTTQAQQAVRQGAQYVTIEIGANDACTRTVAEMTPTTTFKANVAAALAALGASAAAPQIFVASIPSLQRLYEVNRASSSARFTWSLLRICQSMLANPSSTQPADVQRRAAVQQRVDEYNIALRDACSAVASCRFDGGAVAGYAFARADISTRDYFHPSVAGQARLSSITWPTTQWVSP
ncbi:GDSL-type esterase/lipase family protein [Agrococcus jenensis]|uniref:Lysophospholipase L1-like esterase n=1 Tax=Agrococcus jenensis TaxID=46353 RepID=A0A3N2APU5_9MICO|nr:GDSL-type esterase/lipase family protein [Agrococcus jenensis]ROR64928.1 lysophospholipase L1-like esterase [Agrococcus jenensis]